MKSILSLPPLSECAAKPAQARAAIVCLIALVNAAFFVDGPGLIVMQVGAGLLFMWFIRAMFGSLAQMAESFTGQTPPVAGR